jgi:signal transduction histidine kinase
MQNREGRLESATMRPVPAEGPGIKAALLLGFGLTVGLWLWAGYDFTRRMAHVERQATAINVRYMEAQELLASVRPQVLLVSVNVRNALLDRDLSNLDDYRLRISRILATIDSTLRQYVPVLDSAVEQERVLRLRSEIEGFGEAILQVMSSASDRPHEQTRALLSRVVPRRDVVIRVTEEVQGLNRAAFVQQQAAMADAYRTAQREVWQQLGVSLIASLAIALLATLYVVRLEHRLRREREKDILNTRDLQRLSAKLVRAQEEERRTIARELHDEVGQVLMAIRVELALAEKRLNPVASADVLRDAQSITERAVHTVRDLSHILHPALLDDLGLAAALEWYLEPFGRRHGIRVTLRHNGMQVRLRPEVEIAAYRIVQEALTNVAKHAHASSCTVTLERGDQSLRIIIQDDGAGFDPATVETPGAHRGLGLLGLRERVWQLLGTIQVDSAPGRGTMITVEIPIYDAAIVPARAPIVAAASEPKPEPIGG